jgi:serine/threonine-protein kinase
MTTTPPPLAEGRAEPDLSGRRLGDYQILRRLGRGGMAEVYLAEQISLRRQVAMKFLRSSLAGDEAYVRRFHHEAQSAAKLVHANIVAIYEVGCIDGWHYIAQEYVPGQNLKQLLGRLGRGLDAPQAANIIRQVAAALHKAAEQNITHRDIKPENIMIAGSGEVKVADFGLARVAQSGEALNLTQIGITMGTPLYMSPEQVEGKEVDPRSDLYSLGVTAYQMLAGRTPFDGETALAVAVQHLKQEPQRLEDQLPEVPPGLCRLVHRLLEKQPKDRYQRAIDVLKDLRQLAIPGLDIDWAADLPGWNAEMSPSLEGRLHATQQLSLALKSDKQYPRGWTLGRVAAVLVAMIALGLVVGASAAWISRPKPLLAVSEDGPSAIPKMATVQEQYAYAQFASPEDKEAAYKAVSEHFDPAKSAENQRHAWLATKGLAAFYLNQDRLEEALPLYESLSYLDPQEERVLYLAGLAGCAVIFDRQLDLQGDEADIPAKSRLPIYLAKLNPVSDEELQQIGNSLYLALQDVLDERGSE